MSTWTLNSESALQSAIGEIVCEKCGTTKKYKCGQCVFCKKEYSRKYREANKQKVKAARKENYKKNKEMILSRNKEWRVKNSETLNARIAAYRDANREKLRLLATEYRKNNLQKIKEYRVKNRDLLNAKSEKYRRENLDVFKVLSHNRRARVSGVGGRLSKEIKDKLFLLQKGKCACCGASLGEDFHLDHIIPIALGGANIDSNVQLLRAECNQRKGMKHPIDYMQSKGMLL